MSVSCFNIELIYEKKRLAAINEINRKMERFHGKLKESKIYSADLWVKVKQRLSCFKQHPNEIFSFCEIPYQQEIERIFRDFFGFHYSDQEYMLGWKNYLNRRRQLFEEICGWFTPYYEHLLSYQILLDYGMTSLDYTTRFKNYVIQKYNIFDEDYHYIIDYIYFMNSPSLSILQMRDYLLQCLNLEQLGEKLDYASPPRYEDKILLIFEEQIYNHGEILKRGGKNTD